MISIIFFSFLEALGLILLMLIALSPYLLIKGVVRKLFYKMGIDLYLEKEKVKLGLTPAVQTIEKDNFGEDKIIIDLEIINRNLEESTHRMQTLNATINKKRRR